MFQRNLRELFVRALGDTPVVLIHGARQTGKTTLAREISAQGRRAYVTLDDATVLSAASHDPDGFVGGMKGPVTIDEVQRAPELFRAIKASVDRDRVPGRFLLTGSANVMMLPRLSESLAGRMEMGTLWPLSQGELAGRRDGFVDWAFGGSGTDALGTEEGEGGGILERIERGGYPEPLERAERDRRDAWYASYLTTILQRDIRDISNVEGLVEMPRLLALIASRAAGVLNATDLSRGLSISLTTVKRYLSLFEATFLIVTIPAWSSNRGLRLSKSPKVMLADTGLGCHLLGVDAARLAVDGQARGALMENFVAMEIVKQLGWSRMYARPFHFRTAAGKEVDLVLEDRSGRVVGIEVKSAVSVRAEDFRGLRALREVAGDGFVRGVVVYNGTEAVSFGDGMVAIPVGWLWG